MVEQKKKDLFEETTMTFGEHLEELRTCLFKALTALILGFLVGLMLGGRVVDFIQSPLKKALTDYYQTRSQEDIQSHKEALEKAGYPLGDDAGAVEKFAADRKLMFQQVYINPAELLDKLKESYPDQFKNDTLISLSNQMQLRRCAVDGLLNPQVIERLGITEEQSQRLREIRDAWEEGVEELEKSVRGIKDLEPAARKEELSQLGEDAADPWKEARSKALAVLNPEQRAAVERILGERPDNTSPDMVRVFLWYPIEEDTRVQAKSLNAHEAFIIYIKASLLVGAMLASPYIFYQIWTFVAAGLYRHEKRYIHVFLPFSLGLFLLGASLAFFFVFEPVLKFLFSFNRSMGIDPDPRISEWLGFVLILPLGFGISFQLPLVMLFLERIGIFDIHAYLSKWRIAILVIFVMAMFLTPADPTSMILMAFPLTILYFGGILLCKYMPRSHSPYEELDEES